jgi:cytochrome c biogenesis protein CcdA
MSKFDNMINYFRIIFSKFDEVIYYFRIIAGILFIVIGLWAEISLLREIKRRDIRFLSDVDYVYYSRLDDLLSISDDTDDLFEYRTEERKINHNYHILIGLSTVAGAILLSKRKES